jgi:colicin import membrane protein
VNELQISEQIARGTLPSPQEFCSMREPSIWLSEEMQRRCLGLPVVMEHPEGGMLNSPEFAARAVGMIVYSFVRGSDLMGVARVLDAAAIEILKEGADTSPALQFAPGTGARIDIGGKSLLIEPEPMLVDHLAVCAKGVWTRDGAPGVENTSTESTLENEKVAA